MTLMEFLVLLVVAGVCGSIGRAITGFTAGGCFASIAIGFIGALLGSWLARELNLPELFTFEVGSANFPIIWSIVGSALFVALIALITGRPKSSSKK